MKALARVLGVLSLVLGWPAWAGASPSAWGASAMEKVRPRTQPGVSSAVQLVAARNEFVSFQVGLHGGDSGWSGVSASLPALEGPTRIEGADIVLYREVLLYVTKPTTPYSEVGGWPDGLIPDVDETVGEKRRAFPLDVPANESRALWVDVHVPQDAPPGEYLGTLEVVGGGYRAQVQVSLTVVDWVMPSTASLRTDFLVWTPMVCKAFTGQRDCSRQELFPLLSSLQKLGLEHRITFISQFDPDQVPDWPTFDTWWAPFLSATAPLRLPGARMTCVQYAGAYTPAQLADFGAQAGARGWLPLALDMVGDEPPYHVTYDEVHARAALSRQMTPQVRTMLTVASTQQLEQHGLTDLIDIAVVMVNFLGSPWEQRVSGQSASQEAFLRLPNRELWLYQGCMSHGCGGVAPENVPGQGWPSYMVDRPAAKARAMEWLSFQEDATGEFYYDTVEMLSTAWTNQYAYGGNGDGTILYPGTVAAIGGTTPVPLPSMRLKLIRLGMQDFEWLKWVRDAGDPDFARQVAQELIPAPWRVPDDGEAFERARMLLIQRGLVLSGAAVPDSVVEYLRAHPGRPPRDVIEPVLLAQ
ncbi:MAG: hypothetical protein ACXU86_10925 [Archangium sp.]